MALDLMRGQLMIWSGQRIELLIIAALFAVGGVPLVAFRSQLSAWQYKYFSPALRTPTPMGNLVCGLLFIVLGAGLGALGLWG